MDQCVQDLMISIMKISEYFFLCTHAAYVHNYIKLFLSEP